MSTADYDEADHPTLGKLKLYPFIRGQADSPSTIAARNGKLPVVPLPPIPLSQGKGTSAHPAGLGVTATQLAILEKAAAAFEKTSAAQAAAKIECSLPKVSTIAQPAGNNEQPPASAQPEDAQTGKPPVDPLKAAFDKLTELSEWVDQGDEDASRQIFEILDQYPTLWQEYGDMGTTAEGALVAAAFGRNHALKSMLLRNKDAMKAELLGENPSPLEKLAVQRVTICWLYSQYVDIRCSEIMEQGTRIGEWGRMQVFTERRFQTALKSLELVRRALADKKLPASVSTPEEKTVVEKRTVRQRVPPESEAPKKKSAVKHRKPPAACTEEISCNSSAEPFVQGETPPVKGAQRLAPYLNPTRANGTRTNGHLPQPAGAAS